ncbi:hypothetical protein [Streptomyces sp. HPF1205]|uniref:hypothetical protein n=1 Tax=Streptomyces sp. HPF1205 TaxID=2873262 RepID=UPI001CECD1C6|nr:hypothetical protein [Streptomyces sp. HPF1205]
MNSAPHLLTEDRADFEHVLGDALRIVLDERDGGSPLNAEQLRTKALAAADAITAMVTQEYDSYVTLRAGAREAARESVRSRERRAFGYAALGVADGAGSGAGIAAVMAVLTPLLAGAAAVIFLLIGYILGAVSPEPGIAHPLRTAGWFFAAVAAAAVLLGGVGLLLTALRDSSSAVRDAAEALPPEVAAARAAWREALLARGLLPFLTDALDRAVPGPAPAPTPAPTPTSAPHLPRLGYSRPDFTSPQTPTADGRTD